MKHTTQLSIVLLATQKEYQSGDVTACLNKYFKTNASVDKKIDLHIFFNKGEESDYNDLLDYKNCENVNEVKIKSHKLEGLDDLYARTPYDLQKLGLPTVPLLGGSSGPNNLFFNSMIPLMDSIYRDFLMIECDTFPVVSRWIDSLIDYCDRNTFMIAGSTYLGECNLPQFQTWTGHLNGVAIYRASSNLSVFFNLSRKTIQSLVQSNQNHFISFDVGMHFFLSTLLGRKYFNNPNIPGNFLIDSPVISNYSLPQDFAVSVEKVKEDHPQTIILHKKTSPKKIPVFLHIPKNAGTYVLNLMHTIHTHYRDLNLKSEFDQSCVRMCFVKLDKVRQLTAFIYDKHYHCDNSNAFTQISPDQYEVAADDFYQCLSQSTFDLFSLQINATKLGAHKEFGFCHKLCSITGHTPSFFTILRSPFDRAQSIFNYLNSEDSSHEPTYNQLTSDSFKSYIHSSQLEDSWVIRHLRSLNEEEPLTNEHFDQTVNQLRRFSFVGNMANVTETVYSVLHECYGISRDLMNFNLDSAGKNKSSYTSCKFHDLDIDTQNKFICRTDFDIRLYDYFCNSDNFFENSIASQPARNLVTDPQIIPVFHHIAKNAGTYILSWAQMLCRRYHIMRGDNQKSCWTANRIRRALVQIPNGRQLTIVYYTPTDLTGNQEGILNIHDCKISNGQIDKSMLVQSQNSHINSILQRGGDEQTNIMSLDQFLSFCQSKDIEPFCIIIDPMDPPGYIPALQSISLIMQYINQNHTLNFTVLRNPYERAQSLFHYLKSEDSSHEPTHNSIQAESFENYIQSEEVEDSWFLRYILDIPNSDQISENDLILAHHKHLNNFIITDISNSDKLINSVFYQSYGIQQSDVEDHVVQANINRNSTSNKLKIKFEDLNLTAQQKFLDRTYWDRKLWEKYCKNVQQ